jgi:hypothetical protein
VKNPGGQSVCPSSGTHLSCSGKNEHESSTFCVLTSFTGGGITNFCSLSSLGERHGGILGVSLQSTFGIGGNGNSSFGGGIGITSVCSS